MSTTTSIVVGLVVLAWLLWRQATVRVVPSRFRLGLPLILGAIGVVNLDEFAKTHHLGTKDVVALALSLIVGAGGFGALRAMSTRIWRAQGQIYRQGTWVTIALWLVFVALHLLIDAFSAFGSGSLLLYLAITLGVQLAVVQFRAGRLGPTSHQPAS